MNLQEKAQRWREKQDLPIKARVPYMTTMAAAKATAEGIKTVIEQGEIGVMSLQDIHAAIE